MSLGAWWCWHQATLWATPPHSGTASSAVQASSSSPHDCMTAAGYLPAYCTSQLRPTRPGRIKIGSAPGKGTAALGPTLFLISRRFNLAALPTARLLADPFLSSASSAFPQKFPLVFHLTLPLKAHATAHASHATHAAAATHGRRVRLGQFDDHRLGRHHQG